MGPLVGNIRNSTYSHMGINGIFGSVLYTSLILTMILIIIVALLVPKKKNTKSWVMFKLFIYTLISVLGVVALHNSIVKSTYQVRYQDRNAETLLSHIGNAQHNPLYLSNRVQVAPRAGGYNAGVPNYDYRYGADPMSVAQAPLQAPLQAPMQAPVQTYVQAPVQQPVYNVQYGGQHQESVQDLIRKI